MEKPATYCDFVRDLESTHLHRIYHDTAYGFPITDDRELFERLILEINQAGLSWSTILKKQMHFKEAFDQWDIEKIAQYQDTDKQRLMSDAGIIRNRLKIEATIHNAQVIRQIQKTQGSFANWIEAHHPRTKEEWTKLFKKTFRFTGGEIVGEFLMSIGYLSGAHTHDCPIYQKIAALKPAWSRISK